MAKNQHFVPPNSHCAVRGVGNERVIRTTETQSQAMLEIAMNQGSEMIIHRPNGQIRERNSYGNDPFPPEG